MRNRSITYNYYIVPNRFVICVSSYAGKPVKGVAKCHPDDAFDSDFGMRLAKARCDLKVAMKRKVAAAKKLRIANDALIDAQSEYEKRISESAEARDEYQEVLAVLEKLESDAE